MIMAFLTPMALVETQVAIAFGASVQPFTNITPSVSIEDTRSIGLLIIWFINSNNPIFSVPEIFYHLWNTKCNIT